jgi:hypothetical protein
MALRTSIRTKPYTINGAVGSSGYGVGTIVTGWGLSVISARPVRAAPEAVALSRRAVGPSGGIIISSDLVLSGTGAVPANCPSAQTSIGGKRLGGRRNCLARFAMGHLAIGDTFARLSRPRTRLSRPRPCVPAY